MFLTMILDRSTQGGKIETPSCSECSDPPEAPWDDDNEGGEQANNDEVYDENELNKELEGDQHGGKN
jgi:hypothetical protein